MSKNIGIFILIKRIIVLELVEDSPFHPLKMPDTLPVSEQHSYSNAIFIAKIFTDLGNFCCMRRYFLLYYNKAYHRIQKGVHRAKESGYYCHVFPQILLYWQKRKYRQRGEAVPGVHSRCCLRGRGCSV